MSRELFDYNEDFFCQRENCSNLLKDAFKTSCGHYLCADCVGETEYTATALKRQALCPIKDCEKRFQYSSDEHLREQIRQSHVSCLINGCNWSGTYTAYTDHIDKHPPEICEPVSKKKASHILVKIEDKESLDSTAQQLRQSANSLLQRAESIDQITGGASYVERVSADSLKRIQANGAASSNNSLKRAGIEMFLDERSHTLNAQRADTKIYFGIRPERENLPVQQAANRESTQDQMVIGSTAYTALQPLSPIESTQLTSQLNSLGSFTVTPLFSPVRERGPKFTDYAAASPSSPTKLKPVKCRGKPPMVPGNPFQTPSPLTPITNSSAMFPAPPQATPDIPRSKVPPSALLKAAARKMSFGPDATPKKRILPPVVDECSECEDNKESMRILTAQSTEMFKVLTTQIKMKKTFFDLIKNCHCNRSKENEESFRGRLKTF